MPLIKQHFIRLGLVHEKIGRDILYLFLFFFSVNSLVAENRVPIKEMGDPIFVENKKTLLIDLPTLKTTTFILEKSALEESHFKSLLLPPNSVSLHDYTLTRYSSISKLSIPTVKLKKYTTSKNDQRVTLSIEKYPDYSPASLNWSVDYTHSFHYYQQALETKRLFRQNTKDLSSELSSFIASSTSECIEAIEWKITEGFIPQEDPQSEKTSLVLIKNSSTTHSFKIPKLFSIDTLSPNDPPLGKWEFAAQKIQETRFFSLFPESFKKPPVELTHYSISLISSYLEESGFKPIQAYVKEEKDSLDIDYTTALLAVQSDLSRTNLGKHLSLIRLFPVSNQFYTASMKKEVHLEPLHKMEMTLSFLSSDFLDQELNFPKKINFQLIPILSQFPIPHKKIEKIGYISPLELQSLPIHFELASLSLKAKKISPNIVISCSLSPYKGEDILENFTISHPFSSKWITPLSIYNKGLVSTLQTPTKTLTPPSSSPYFQSGHNLIILDSPVYFSHFPNRLKKPSPLSYTPINAFNIFSTDNIPYKETNLPFVTEIAQIPVDSIHTTSFIVQNTFVTSDTPIQESLETTPLFTNFVLEQSLYTLSINSYSEYYTPFLDKTNEHFFSLYGVKEPLSSITNKEDLTLVSSLSIDTFVMPTRILYLTPPSLPASCKAFSENERVPICSFIAKSDLNILTQKDPLGSEAYSSSLVRILPHVHLIETTPFDPLFLLGTASIEINRAHRMISFELASLPSLAELDTDSLGDDFLIEAKITPQMNAPGYLFSLKLKAADLNFLPPEKHHVIFVVDRNASIEKHRYDIYKKSILQSLTYLDSSAHFNICFFDNQAGKMSFHDLKPTKTAQLLAQKFLQNTAQLKGSSFADFITLMQEIKKAATTSKDLYSVILLSNGSSMKNIRLNRESLKELLWDWPDSLSLYTTAISDNNNLPMLELLSKIGKGELSLAKTHSAFGRKLSTLVRRISKPIAHGIAVTALSSDPELKIEFSNQFSGQLFADRSFTIYGKTPSLCNIDLLLQGRRENRFINLRKQISLKDAEKGKNVLEKEFYSQLGLHELISFIFSNDQTHLLKAKTYLDPFDSPLTNQL